MDTIFLQDNQTAFYPFLYNLWVTLSKVILGIDYHRFHIWTFFEATVLPKYFVLLYFLSLFLVLRHIKSEQHDSKKTQTDESVPKKRKETTLKPLKVAAAKPFLPVCMLLVQLASMNIWLLEDIIFQKSLSLSWDFSNRHVVAFLEACVLKKVHFFALSPH